MSNSLPLTARQGLDLLARLRQAVARLAADEARVLGDLQKQEQAVRRKYREAVHRAREAEEARRLREEEQWHAVLERTQTFQATRRARIQSAYAQSLRALQAMADRKKDQHLGDLQMRHFRMERQQPEERKRIEHEHAEENAQLLAGHAQLLALAERVRRMLGKLPKLRSLFEKGAGEGQGQLHELPARLASLEEKVHALESLPLPRSLPFLPLVLILVCGGLFFGVYSLSHHAIAALVVALLPIPAVYFWFKAAYAQAAAPAAAVAEELGAAQRLYDTAQEDAQLAYEQKLDDFNTHYAAEVADIARQWEMGDEVARRFAHKRREKLETQVLRLIGRHDRSLAPRQARRDTERANRHLEAEARFTAQQGERDAEHAAESAALEERQAASRVPLLEYWQTEIVPLFREVEEAQARLFPIDAEHWQPASGFTDALTFGRLTLDLAHGHSPQDAALALPGPTQVELPLSLVFPEQGSMLFETPASGEPCVIGTLNSTILRLFSAVPPGKLVVTIIDPVGLGQNFAGLMTLGDYEESLINRRIWTQREQIDERLAELNEHIEKMIQMYLRDEFATITQYNAQAGTVAEKYHLLVVADFPASFSETAARRLQSIAVSGPRCGVFTLLHRDTRQPPPEGLTLEELHARSVCLHGSDCQFAPKENPAGALVVLDPPPDPAVATALVHQIGRASVDSNRVEVPFAQIAPPDGQFWQSKTTQELRVAIGRTGATKLQYLAIGKGTRQHALFAGKTGSGKSTLFHVIITNLALWCSPEEVEFYLIDFKKGVEFKCYAAQRLPHARVVAIESDREFALSVLQRVDEELRRRGDLFRALGVQDLAGYKKAGGTEPLPRSLLVIDEFQEFFVEDDTTAQGAALLFDRIVRQGRAFGIHVLLGSQTLGGAYSLARTTLGQMVIRVALQCNEADAYLIMDENNAAPRLLSRPGEGIYNDAAGAVEGNSPFQVVWLSDDERDRRLAEIRAFAESRHVPARTPVVFEGNAPAAVGDNDLLRAALAATPERPPSDGRFWLGAPNAIKGPTEVRLRRQSGHHLLIVGQREEAALVMQALALLALGAQFPRGTARFIFLASAPPDSPEWELLQKVAATCDANLVRGADFGPALAEISSELKARLATDENGSDRPAIFLFIQGLQRFKKLKQEDEFSFSATDDGEGGGAQLAEIITEGPSAGVHLIASLDTFSNVQRWLSRKAIGEFAYRVLFQMSANDSASLIDSPAASNVGLYRALLYNEQEGTLETFRPYAKPDTAWLESAASVARKFSSTE